MRTLRRVWAWRSARVALLALALIALLAATGGWLAPYDPLALAPERILQAPGAQHLLGTDYLGRDVLSRLVEGTGRSVVGSLEAVASALILGTFPGLASLWAGQTVEWVSLRLIDTLMTLPFIIFVIAVVGAFGNGMHTAMLALGVLYAPQFFRVVRAAAMGLKQAQYVEAAELMGASRWWVLRRHIWSKILPTIVVTAAHVLSSCLLVFSALTFLGVGVQPPAATWGGMLASDLDYLTQQPWAPIFPSLMIIITVAAVSVLGDAVRDGTGSTVAGATSGRKAEPKAPTDHQGGAVERTAEERTHEALSIR
jgi:peptide/nickel transport system permease protein